MVRRHNVEGSILEKRFPVRSENPIENDKLCHNKQITISDLKEILNNEWIQNSKCSKDILERIIKALEGEPFSNSEDPSEY